MFVFLLIGMCLCFAAAVTLLMREKVLGRPRSLLVHILVGLGAGLSLLCLLALWHASSDPVGFPVRGVPLAASGLLAIISLLTELVFAESFFTILALPTAIGFALLSLLLSGHLIGIQFQGGIFIVHVGFAVAGQCLFIMAAFAATTYLYQLRKLKSKNRMRAIRYFPPLARLDMFLIRFLCAGLVMFGAGLLAGLAWLKIYTGNIDILTGKTAFSIFIFLYFLSLLLGRRQGFLPGNRIAWMTSVGTLVTLLLSVVVNGPHHWFPGDN